MKDYLLELADFVYGRIAENKDVLVNRAVHKLVADGDAQFNIDEQAESAVLEFVQARGEPIAVFMEAKGLMEFGKNPEHMLIIDPIDGTRPNAAGLEMSCFSVALAPFKPGATLGDIEFALLRELKSGAWVFGAAGDSELEYSGFDAKLPNLSSVVNPENMFWCIEFNGTPIRHSSRIWGALSDLSSNTGGVFVFNSITYSLLSIIAGRLDAYMDMGNLILKRYPELESDFRAIGAGNILHLFPYDIAACVFLAKKAGVVVTDGRGESMDGTLLTDMSPANQQSCLAASTPELHEKLLAAITENLEAMKEEL